MLSLVVLCSSTDIYLDGTIEMQQLISIALKLARHLIHQIGELEEGMHCLTSWLLWFLVRRTIGFCHVH